MYKRQTIRAKARTLPERLGKVIIDFVIDMPRQLQGACRSVIVTPYLHKYGEAHALQDITIRGGLFSRVQQRDYWQFGKYVRAFAPDSSAEARAFARFVKYPYPEGVRLDSVAAHPGHISYYYSQEVPTDETSKTMLVTLQGRVVALDDSSYTLPPSDTLTYHVSSMLSFVDTTTRYKIKVINKYATVQDRNYIQFLVNDTRVLDTLGRNTAQLGKIQARMAGLIAQQEFLERGIQPLREFMYKQTQTEDVDVFMDISGDSWESGALDDIPLSVLAPAFMVGQLREAFTIGFIIYIPFIVIDMVVSSALMSMGMMMLPPTTISMPFKILLFVLADGWNLIIVNLVRTFK